MTKYLDNALDDQPNFQVFGSNQKNFLPKFNFYLYADALVVAEEPIIAEENTQAITNPILIIEILSKSTEQYGRKLKFLEYRSLPSLKEYALVQQDVPEVLTFFRTQADTWKEQEFSGLSTLVVFKSLGISLDMEAIYRRVDF